VLPRFYAPDLDPAAATIVLAGDESRHLSRVLRLHAGDEVAVFDGRGNQFRALIENTGRDAVVLRLQEPLPSAPPPAVEVVVVQAVLKGSSMDDAIRDATMMGAAAIVPVLTAHTDVKSGVARRRETVDRWRRVALAAVKQSRRATLPEIDPPRSLEEALAMTADVSLLFVEPGAPCTPRPVRSLMSRPTPSRAAVLLGPEGGWAADEIEAALSRGSIAVTLGPLTLRAESMPVAALAALAAVWQV